ncbi:hypothetical protein CHS0354_006242 [Potamilus streckersoni]|uniref:Death domain-containing protein n=1 Tax=Potamilus streckersoni TaxID=2493646 RepID=A0AAE0S478_9BIVA|nr:hypothetical protein CHS0354_006242 [Potamilus streckersoni]
MQDLIEKLFLAVSKAKTANIQIYLKQGAPIDARDENGMTPLIRAAKLRNYVVQKLLLRNGANSQKKDWAPKCGCTALHYSASTGDVECIKLLLAYQAQVSATDKVGCTPLHYAVDRGHAEAVDLLLFCGANAFLKDSAGHSPFSACQDPELKEVLRESRTILNGIQNNDIFLQHVELHSGQTYQLKQLDLTVHTNKNMGTDSLSFLCRKVRPEYSNKQLHPASSRELLISDTFEFRLSGTRVDGTVELEVPLYTHPEPYEEIVMKTNERPYVNDESEVLDKVERVGNEHKWRCRVKLDLTKIRAFVLLARPKVEKFSVNHLACTIRSKVDDFIRLNIQRDTFTNKEPLSLEVIPCPMYKPEEFVSLESISYFYEFRREEQPHKEVQVTLPVPRDFDGECVLYVLCTKCKLEEFYNERCTPQQPEEGGEGENKDKKMSLEEKWEIIEDKAKEHDGKVSFRMNHFSICVPIEMRAGTPKSEVRSIVDDLCSKASEKEMYIVFFVMVKPLDKNKFSVIIECTLPKRVRPRMDFWRSKDYREQKPRESGDRKTVPGMKYQIVLKTETLVQCSFGGNNLPLHFHPLRKNFQKFEVQLQEPIVSPRGIVLIEKEEEAEMRDKDMIEPLEISLTGYPLEASTQQDDNLGDSNYKGFTNDKLMRKLSEELEDEWIKVCVLLGLSYQTIDSVLQDKGIKDFTTKKFKLLLLWRDMSRYRHDLGVHDLLYALKRSGRDDLVQYLRKELLNWYEDCKDENDAFYGWLKITIYGPDVERNEDTIEPLSDRFFLALIERGKDKLQSLGPFLNLSTPEMNLIFSDALLGNMEHKLLKMFATARDKHETKKAYLLHLLNGLFEESMNGDLEWVENSARRWSEKREINESEVKAKSTMEDEIFLTEVLDILEDFDAARTKRINERSRPPKQILPPKIPSDRKNRRFKESSFKQIVEGDGRKSHDLGHVSAEETSFEVDREHGKRNSRVDSPDILAQAIGENKSARPLEDGMTFGHVPESSTKDSPTSQRVGRIKESKEVESEGSILGEGDYRTAEDDFDSRSDDKQLKYTQDNIGSSGDVNATGGVILGESGNEHVYMEKKGEKDEKNGKEEEDNERFITNKSEDLLPISLDHPYEMRKEQKYANTEILNENKNKGDEASYDVEDNDMRHGNQEMRENEQPEVKDSFYGTLSGHDVSGANLLQNQEQKQKGNDSDSFDSAVDYDFYEDKPNHS